MNEEKKSWMKWRTLFLSLVPLVENFVQNKSQYYHIDPSHDLHHSLQVKELGCLIAKRDHHLSSRQQEILYLSCMLHDMCDAKYTPRVQAILDISNFLTKKCFVSMLTHDAVMEIISSMSYSQIVRPNGKVVYPTWLLTDQNGWGEVFHIVRQADLLTSYDLKRMIHYKCQKMGLVYSCDIYQDIQETVKSRMSKLLEKKLFLSPTAITIARKWHQDLCDNVNVLTEDEIYPIFYEPLESMEHFDQRIFNALEFSFPRYQ